jgi:NAD(P)H-hydrate epimerase
MSGAIALAGMSALRSGAGLVTLAVPEAIQPVVASFEPSYMTMTLPQDEEGRIAQSATDVIISHGTASTAVACGPGLGRSAELDQVVATLYGQLACPMVVDADALNALADQSEVLSSPGGPRVLTPHPGEFARLVGQPHDDLSQRESAAIALAEQLGVVIVLKGHATLVTDGTTSAHNTTGNPGMATGGTGDVLTGVITSLLCQGLSPLDAARLGVHLHGLAGDFAAAEMGEVSLIATDLLRELPRAFATLG